MSFDLAILNLSGSYNSFCGVENNRKALSISLANRLCAIFVGIKFLTDAVSIQKSISKEYVHITCTAGLTLYEFDAGLAINLELASIAEAHESLYIELFKYTFV